jgi:hypothetical protein
MRGLPGTSSMRNMGRRWWFLPLLLLPQLIPPFATQGYRLIDWPAVNQFIITHPVKAIFPAVYPVFKVIPLLLLAGIVFNNKAAARLFLIWVAFDYVLVSLLQSFSISSRYGVAVCTGNLVTFLFLAVIWACEALRPAVLLSIRNQPLRRFWPVILALFAFWYPVNPQTLLPDFNPAYLITSGAGLSFCLSTPLFLSIALIAFPSANKGWIACAAFVGLFMGVSNLVLEWVIIPTYWWIGVLHLPLVLISAYALIHVITSDRIHSTS